MSAFPSALLHTDIFLGGFNSEENNYKQHNIMYPKANNNVQPCCVNRIYHIVGRLSTDQLQTKGTSKRKHINIYEYGRPQNN